MLFPKQSILNRRLLAVLPFAWIVATISWAQLPDITMPGLGVENLDVAELRVEELSVEELSAEGLSVEELGEPVPLADSPPPGLFVESMMACETELASECLPTHFGSGSPKSQYPRVRVTGFFQADTAWFHQSDANIAAIGDVQDGADFRRARLAATGDVADNVAYMIEFDFGFPGRPSFMDVWLEIQDLAVLQNVRVGQYRNPFGLDGLTSAKELTFIERGLPFAFLPFRQVGVMTYGVSEQEDVTWALSGFRFPTDVYGGQIGDNGGYGMATRLTGVLLDRGQRVIHIGGAFALIDPANDAVRYRSQPEIFMAETGGAGFVPSGVPASVPPFVDTGVISTNTSRLLSVELATTCQSFHAQAEVIYAVVDRQAGSNVAFSGVSTQAAYILTGEHRPYNRKKGVLGRVVPDRLFGKRPFGKRPFGKRPFGKHGYGAWELASRWSYLDLDDADVRGGRLNNLTLGLNWYLNRYTKFQFNYIHASLNSEVNGQSDANIFATRAQVDF